MLLRLAWYCGPFKPATVSPFLSKSRVKRDAFDLAALGDYCNMIFRRNVVNLTDQIDKSIIRNVRFGDHEYRIVLDVVPRFSNP